VAIGAFFMKEPPRGQFEKSHVLGEVIEEEQPAPISMEAAFARLKKINTIRTVLIAFCALASGSSVRARCHRCTSRRTCM